MKRKLFIVLFACISLVSIAGCNNKKEEKKKTSFNENGNFYITCEGVDESVKDVKTTNKIVYYFNNEQYATHYEVITTSIYSDDATYKTNKKSAEETATNNSDENITYRVDDDDTTRTIKLSNKVNIRNEELNSEEKEQYKASKIIEKAEAVDGVKCNISGIEKDQLK